MVESPALSVVEAIDNEIVPKLLAVDGEPPLGMGLVVEGEPTLEWYVEGVENPLEVSRVGGEPALEDPRLLIRNEFYLDVGEENRMDMLESVR